MRKVLLLSHEFRGESMAALKDRIQLLNAAAVVDNRASVQL